MTIGGSFQLLAFGASESGTGSGADITVNSGGALTAGSLSFDLFHNIFTGGVTDGLNLTLDVTGALTTTTEGITLTVFTSTGVLTTTGDRPMGNISGNATINVNAGSVSTEGGLVAQIFNPSGNIGGSAGINFTTTGDVTTTGFDSFDIHNVDGSIGTDANILVSIGGNYSSNRIEALIENNNGTIGSGASIAFNVGGNLTSSTDASFTIDNSSGGVIGLPPGINVQANNIMTAGDFAAYIDTSSNGAPTSDSGSTVHIEAFSEIHVGGRLNVLGSVRTDGDVDAQTIAATSIDTQLGGDILAGVGGIRRFAVPGERAPDVLHTLTARSVTSDGGINFDGVDAFGAAATRGGSLTINADSLSFNVEGDIQGFTSLNGGNSAAGFGAGSGGIFTVNTSGRIDVDSAIEATTGLIFDDTAAPSGDGGTVNLSSTNDTVSVSSRIEVSSAQPTPGPARRSAAGGNIRLASGKAGIVGGPRPVAIDVGSSGQLLALLAASAPGPGGKVVISATGANSDVNVRGRVRADRGLVDIRHTGTGGNVTLDGPFLAGSPNGTNGTNGTLDVHGDVVKVAALGDNGVLRVGHGVISADSTLQLYATGFNGEVRFVGNVTLTGTSVKSIAGNAVTINNGVFVNIGGPAASVYVNSTGGVPNANYTGSGGNGSTTGTFNGSGANPPQPLGQAPPLGPAPPRPGGPGG